jgi:hypothetical protein
MAAEIANVRAQLCVLNGVVAAAAVSFIANDGMFEPREMNPNLVRAAGFEFDVEQREAIETLAHTIKRERAATAADDGHARTIRRVASEGLIDASRVGLEASVDESDVRLEHRAIAKLI